MEKVIFGNRFSREELKGAASFAFPGRFIFPSGLTLSLALFPRDRSKGTET
jgi:hypothetical protein